MMPLHPNKYSVFNLNYGQKPPKTKTVFLKWCISEVLAVPEPVCVRREVKDDWMVVLPLNEGGWSAPSPLLKGY